MITQQRLKEVVDYNPETGVFINRIKRGPCYVGKVLGSPDPLGYIHITVDSRSYNAHSLAWLYVYGKFPSIDIDHVDQIKANNWISNLRLANRTQNCGNVAPTKANMSGLKGVYWRASHKRWIAQIRFEKKNKHLGVFYCKIEAAKAYDKAALEHFGEFAWLNFPDDKEVCSVKISPSSEIV